MQLGLRVVRGPSWKWGEQDGGLGHVGSVVKPGLQSCDVVLNDTVFIRWDSGELANYRIGSDDAYDLYQFDTAPGGSVHAGSVCSECRQSEFVGIRWTCQICSDVSLCRECYGNDKHDISHAFVRFDWPTSDGTEVPPRKGSRKVEAIGIFPGATVIRGPDWQWGSQDGGEGSLGLVLSLTDHKASQSLRSWCKVTWNAGNTNDYKVGHEGKLDVVMIEGATGGCYYPEHLAPLGHLTSLPTSDEEPDVSDDGDFKPKPGDRVQVNLDCDIFEAMQQNHGGWNPVLAKCVGRVGRVMKVQDNAILVKFFGVDRVWPINPAVLSPARQPFRKGDEVLISDDMLQVMQLQEGHGGWIPDMQTALGATGTVVSEAVDCDVSVEVSGHVWTFNAACCTRLTTATKQTAGKKRQHSDEDSSSDDADDTDDNDDDDEQHTILGHPRLEQMIRQLVLRHQPNNLLEAVAAGDIDAVKAMLSHLPPMPNMGTRNTLCLALKTASLRGQVDMVRLLLDTGADVSARDENGDSQAHFAVFEGHPDVLSVLVEKGRLDINIVNSQRLTPLHVAVHKGHVECAKRLLAYGCDVNVTDSDNDTALHSAIRLGSHQLIDLLTNNADAFNFRLVNARGFTVLHEAAFNNNCYAAEKVLGGAQFLVDQTQQDTTSPLHVAATEGHTDVAKVLIARKTKLDAKNAEGQTALMLACCSGWIPMIELLVSEGAGVNVADNAGNSPLHVVLAAYQQQSSQQSTSTDVPLSSPKSFDKALSLHKVQSSLPGHLHSHHWLVVACYLVKHGADLSTTNCRGNTPIQYATDSVIADILRKCVTERHGARQCQLCSKELAVTFMPCGHQIACSRCSARTKHCFTCRTPISQTIPPDTGKPEPVSSTIIKSQSSVSMSSESTTTSCTNCTSQLGYLLRPCMHTCCKPCGKSVTKGDKCPRCQTVVFMKVILYGS